jgi:hypothetical protein
MVAIAPNQEKRDVIAASITSIAAVADHGRIAGAERYTSRQGPGRYLRGIGDSAVLVCG